jgi:hypothetical protein
MKHNKTKKIEIFFYFIGRLFFNQWKKAKLIQQLNQTIVSS